MFIARQSNDWVTTREWERARETAPTRHSKRAVLAVLAAHKPKVAHKSR